MRQKHIGSLTIEQIYEITCELLGYNQAFPDYRNAIRIDSTLYFFHKGHLVIIPTNKAWNYQKVGEKHLLVHCEGSHLPQRCPICKERIDEDAPPHKIYCSEKCRKNAFIDRRRYIQRSGDPVLFYEKVCPICHEKYYPKTNKSPTCGKPKCRTTYSRKK